MKLRRKYRPRKPARADGIRALQQIANNLSVLARIESERKLERAFEAEWALHTANQRDENGVYIPTSKVLRDLNKKNSEATE